MARGLCKVAAHSSGGADNVAYIGRPMELSERAEAAEPGRAAALHDLREPTDFAPGSLADDDPVWTWNAPAYVTGDCYGVAQGDPLRAALEGLTTPALTPAQPGGQPAAGGFNFPIGEKRERAIAYFSVLADLEEMRGGPSHLRIMLTVGPAATNRDLKVMVNAFLGENFPRNPAFAAIHRNTEHTHAHLYVHARQIDGARVRLGQKYFRLDESWMRTCAEHLRDPEIYQKHMELKAATLEWKERARGARESGRPVPPKPDRWADHHDTLLTFRPRDDRWCGRLQAQARVAEKRVEWLDATKARPENVAAAREEAGRLRARLDEAAERRGKSKSNSKRALPAEVITVSEARELLLYERDIQRAAKGKTSRRKQPAPKLTAEQGALRFDVPAVEQVGQLGFDFQSPSEPSRATGSTLEPHARPGPKPPVSEHKRVESHLAAAGALTPADEAGRSFGRELMAEVKLARTESCLSVERSAKEKRRLKEQLIEDRGEHARASEEAARHRSLLAARGAAEPPYLLKDDERRYLDFMSGRVPERLRERVMSEIARARIISDRDEETLGHRLREHAPPADASLPARARVERSQPAVAGRKGDETADTKRGSSSPEELQPVLTPARPAETTRGGALTQPGEEVKRLTMQYELAKARAGVLRVAEEEFEAAPHYWASPKHKVSLAGIEEKVAQGMAGDTDVGWLHEARKVVADELSVERTQLPLRRRRAEEESRSLETRLRHEEAARARLGLEMPDVIPSAEELRELVSCAEAARDARLLRRVFEATRGRALREAAEGSRGEPVRMLEETYAGVKLMADVRADRSRVALARAMMEPDKTLLPATDESGRDTVATLEQAGTRKGIRGALGRLVESGAKRRLHEQLLETKDAYFNHLRADVEGREAFRDAAREIVRECRELSRGFGYYAPAVPELSTEQIREARDHAVTRTGAEREDWLTACAQSQKLKDERELAAAAARRAERVVELILPGTPSGEERAELIRSNIQAHRERASIAEQQRAIKTVADREVLGRHDDPGKSRPDPDRTGGSYFGR